MISLPSALQRKIQEGYSFNLGDYISRGFNLVSKNVGLFIVFTLIYIVISAVLSFVPILGFLASLVVTPALMAGYYIASNRVGMNQSLQLNDFFKGFDQIANLAITYLIQYLIMFAAALPGIILLISTVGMAFFAGGFIPGADTYGPSLLPAAGGMFFLGVLLALIPALYFGVSYIYALQLVWFYEMQPWPALETSRKLVAKNFFMVLLFAFVVGIVISLGILLIGVGILFTVPAGMAAIYASFADITELEQEQQTGNDDVIDHFVGIN